MAAAEIELHCSSGQVAEVIGFLRSSSWHLKTLDKGFYIHFTSQLQLA